jgi:hypothetical protein
MRPAYPSLQPCARPPDLRNNALWNRTIPAFARYRQYRNIILSPH